VVSTTDMKHGGHGFESQGLENEMAQRESFEMAGGWRTRMLCACYVKLQRHFSLASHKHLLRNVV
jgi:hypothetical protein